MSSQPAHVRPKVDRAQRASSEADPAERERERRPYAPYRMVPAAYVRIPLVEVAAGAAPRVLSVAAARWSLRSRPFPNLLRFDQARSPSSMRMLSGLDVPGLDKLPPVLSLEAAAAAKPREVAPFLRSLRRMLETESDDILRWTSNGRAFEILDMDRMMEEVLPKYFKHRKYTSFQRQLNYFSFKKWTKSKAVVCTFSNDCFLRDRPDLAWRITRKKSVHSSTTSSSKSGGSTPRKPRPMSVPVPSALAKTSSMKLEPLKLEPLKLEPQPFPSKSSWKRDIAIRVPRAPSAMLVGGPPPAASSRRR
ncbi:HSF-type DNA-binding protein [Phytophthora cinnamomi]|uniref:HSF-type DNA-binding protein n=1 Tax=Phytophthora cinnamomi TaxID=4785 RepID=UPI00355AA502|nr:HSF-type DNA-binding protein [Phytophthora cinnamomi]